MNYLQIWIGKKPKNIIIDCMNSVIDKVEDNDTYTLISTSNFFKDNKKVKWININTYESKIKKNNLLYKLWNHLPESNIDEYAIASCKSDLIRLHYLANNDEVLYLDTDILLKEKIAFNSLKPHSGIVLNRKDWFILYNGNNKEIFDRMINNIIESSYNSRRNKFNTVGRGWSVSLLNIRYNNEIDVIDNKYYEHLNMYSKR